MPDKDFIPAPMTIDDEEFKTICTNLAAGKRVSDQEMADALWYSRDHLPSFRELTTALISGWRKVMNRIDKKNNRIGKLERQLGAVRRFIESQGGKK